MARKVEPTLPRFADSPDQTVQFQLKHYARKSKDEKRLRFIGSRTFTIHNIDLDTAEEVIRNAFVAKG